MQYNLQVIKGALHLHTSLSQDAKGDFRDYALWARENGLDFLIFTEHQGDVSHEMLAGLPQELLGIRLFWFIEQEDPRHHWVQLPGIAVLFHPGEPGKPTKRFKAVEAWNLKRDGPFPSKRVLKQFSGESVLFIGGCDAHRPKGRPVIIEVDVDDPDQLFSGLMSGRFRSTRGRVVLYPDGSVDAPGFLWFLHRSINCSYRFARWLARRTGLAMVARRIRKRAG